MVSYLEGGEDQGLSHHDPSELEQTRVTPLATLQLEWTRVTSFLTPQLELTGITFLVTLVTCQQESGRGS